MRTLSLLSGLILLITSSIFAATSSPQTPSSRPPEFVSREICVGAWGICPQTNGLPAIVILTSNLPGESRQWPDTLLVHTDYSSDPIAFPGRYDRSARVFNGSPVPGATPSTAVDIMAINPDGSITNNFILTVTGLKLGQSFRPFNADPDSSNTHSPNQTVSPKLLIVARELATQYPCETTFYHDQIASGSLSTLDFSLCSSAIQYSLALERDTPLRKPILVILIAISFLSLIALAISIRKYIRLSRAFRSQNLPMDEFLKQQSNRT